MSALNATAINSPEFRSLRSFLLLYTIMSIFILSLLGTIYYANKKEVMLSEHRLSMQLVNENYFPLLRYTYMDHENEFPKDLAYNTALYDENKNLLISYMEKNNVDLDKVISLSEGYIHFVLQIEKNKRDAKYLVYETKDDELWLHETLRDILMYGGVLLLILISIGVYLTKLFLRPMRESIELLDNFIKDTTHELNTPVAAIMANIESIDQSNLDVKMSNKIKRIDIAARTISNIYNDLTYLVLHHSIAVEDKEVNLSVFLQERLEYFKMAIEQKKLRLQKSISPDVYVRIDKNRLGRLVDNLLSNAIKYNKVQGSINVELSQYSLKVSDTGIGIPADKISRIFERYQRADKSVGGFGIGLNIVAMIAKEYGIEIKIDSALQKGTEIELCFNDPGN